MSAITGIFYRNGQTVKPELIKKMNNKLSHRGPDGSEIWSDGPLAFGHQMLWTTTESLHEKLPFHDEKAGLVITADARIDNRKELSKELDIEDKKEISDSYYILKSYEKWGEKCPKYLLGDFAFVIWDENEEKLFCARDHMGIKSFYYYLDENIFAFGTEIKALFTIPEVPYKLNKRKLALFLIRDILDQNMTFYEMVVGLLPSHFLTLNKSRDTIKRYWNLDSKKEIIMDSDTEYVQMFKDIFNESVKCRLRSKFPIGFGLSGGLDSSSIVCTANKIFQKDNGDNLRKLNTFSFIFDEISESDERYYIEKVLNHVKINSYFIKSDDISPLEGINSILWNQDQPFYTPNMSIHNKLFQKVNQKGIRVFLTGEGGDEVVSYGQNHIRDLALSFQWKKLINEINGHSNNLEIDKFKILFGKIIFPSFPNYLKKRIRSHIRGYNNFFSDNEFLRRIGMDYENKLNKMEKFTSKEFHYYVINDFSHHSAVFEPVDRVCGANSIEPRYPFFDKRLIEFCYAIPTEIKLRFGWDRYILRLAMDKTLPKKIQWRAQKTDLSPVYKRNLLLFEKNRIEELLYSDDNEIIKEFIDLNKFKMCFKRYKFNNKQINSSDIWLVILLLVWLKYTQISYR